MVFFIVSLFFLLLDDLIVVLCGNGIFLLFQIFFKAIDDFLQVSGVASLLLHNLLLLLQTLNLLVTPFSLTTLALLLFSFQVFHGVLDIDLLDLELDTT